MILKKVKFVNIVTFLISVLVVLVVNLNVIESTTKLSYNDGLIFYDLKTSQKILPPAVTSSINFRSATSGRLPLIGQPCSCARRGSCGCCAGIKIDRFNFNQKMCTNLTLNLEDLEMKMEVFLNQRNIIMYRLSARNPPPFCIPTPLPIPVELCIKLHDIRPSGMNIHACMDWILKIFSNEVQALHFNCIQFGQDGIQLLPSGNGHDFILGTISIGGGTAGNTDSNVGPGGDINSDVFDEVELDR